MSQPLSRERVSTIEATGIAWRDVVIAVCARNDAAEAEHIAATLLASAAPPDAIAAMSDQQAAEVVRAARAAGRLIPDGVAVTGWMTRPWRHNSG